MKEKENKLIVGSIAWAQDIPEWLLEEVKSERLIYGLGVMINPDCSKVGDAEIIVFLMTTALQAPISREYTNIYMFLLAKLTKRRNKEMPGFLKESLKRGLIGDEERELRELQDMIYHKRGGEIQHPILNFMRKFKKEVDRKEEATNKIGQLKLL